MEKCQQGYYSETDVEIVYYATREKKVCKCEV